MQQSYTSNYLKIYLWQAISLILNFISLFIVIPYLTNQPSIYGIYTVCISVSIFLAYADFGFMAAGQKYAAEFFAKGDIKQEVSIIGFTCFILVIFLTLFSGIFIYLSLNPSFLIKSLTTEREISIASSLLLILALFTPVTFLQRLLQLVFGIRLEDYIIQRTNIFANIIKISSIFWFFKHGQYNVVGYFLFIQVVNLLGCLFTIFIAKKRYQYSFRAVLYAMHFNKIAFAKTKDLAFASLYLTLAWILYYELDTTVISKYLGAERVAIYAIGLTLLTFFRSIFGILFSPFSARFNHFIGIRDLSGLKTFYLHITKVATPIVIIPTLTIALLAKPIILSWVGPHYIESITIARYLILCNLLAFIGYPVGMLLIAQEQIKKMYFIYTLIPILFWGGVIFTYPFLGLKAFAIFKCVAFGISAVTCFFIILDFLEMKVLALLKMIVNPVIIPIMFLTITSLLIKDYLPHDKSKINFLLVLGAAGIIISLAFLVQYLVSSDLKKMTKSLLVSLKK